MTSDVPRARSCLYTILEDCAIDDEAAELIHLALSLMIRAKPCRRTSTKQKPITTEQKRQVRSLKHSDLSQHQIASRVGLANSGRVSEIMTGKRK